MAKNAGTWHILTRNSHARYEVSQNQKTARAQSGCTTVLLTRTRPLREEKRAKVRAAIGGDSGSGAFYILMSETPY